MSTGEQGDEQGAKSAPGERRESKSVPGVGQNSLSAPGEGIKLTYRMSCGMCETGRHYVGTTQENEKVNQAIIPHLNDIWHGVSNGQQEASIPSVIVVDGQEHGLSASSDFMDKLGEHIVQKHCRHEEFDSKGDFLKWCESNIRVQMKIHKYEKRPETDGSFAFINKASHEFVQNQAKKEQSFELIKKHQEEQREQVLRQMSKARTSKEKEYLETVWDQRYNELKEFKEEHGNTAVPKVYSAKPMLATWAEMQRAQYRHKLKGLDKNPAMTDRRETLLEEIGFVKDNKLKPRWDQHGIAVMYGYKFEDVVFLNK